MKAAGADQPDLERGFALSTTSHGLPGTSCRSIDISNHGLGYGVNRGRSMPMLATRGCPYECTFCSSPEMWTQRWYARNPAAVLDEIAAYQERYGATNFDFFDLTAIVKRSWIVEFTQLILDRGMTFTWQLPSGTRSEAIDAGVSRLLYASGCRNVSYAPESGSPVVLKRIKKAVKLDRLRESVAGALAAGLNVKLNIIMGFPDESPRELHQTIRFLTSMAIAGVHDMSISLFSPYPGSPLYNQLTAAGRLPPLSDHYFLGLCAYKDFGQSVSYSDRVSAAALNAYRIAGFVVFYGTQYLIRPWRLGSLIRNLVGGRQESRLDKSLQDFFGRVRGIGGSEPVFAARRVAGEPLPSRTVTLVIPAQVGQGSIDRVVGAARSRVDQVLVLDASSRLATSDLWAAGARVIQSAGSSPADTKRAVLAEATSDVLVFMEPQCSHDPADIVKLTAPIVEGKYDLVIASRATGGSDRRHGTAGQFVRYMTEQLLTLAINYRWRVHLTDTQNGFRAIRRTAVEQLDLSWNPRTLAQETVMKALKRHLKVGEVPSHEYEGFGPASKLMASHFAAINLWTFLCGLF